MLLMSKEPYPSETADRFIVRFPDGMRDRIRDEAAANNRSMNAEIIARLEASFATRPVGGSPITIEALQEEGRKVEELLRRIEKKLDEK